ncbi:MAG: hypothetical protein HC872_02070 [Gammaproteobacteria bacterium]|nr:hypothetical protein [Gammaproteobacteria bacterium]
MPRNRRSRRCPGWKCGNERRREHRCRRQRLLPTLKKHFATEREVPFPPLLGRLVRLYTAIRLRSDPAGSSR